MSNDSTSQQQLYPNDSGPRRATGLMKKQNSSLHLSQLKTGPTQSKRVTMARKTILNPYVFFLGYQAGSLPSDACDVFLIFSKLGLRSSGRLPAGEVNAPKIKRDDTPIQTLFSEAEELSMDLRHAKDSRCIYLLPLPAAS